MASPNQQYHGATFKPHKHFAANSPFFFKKTNLYTLALLLVLCTFSYLFGFWRHDGGGRSVLSVNKSAATATTNTIVSTPCDPSKATTAAPKGQKPLDFSSHHKADDLDSTFTSEVKTYPSCNVNFSEYTPCEDAKRSLKFNRHRLIYRERHCPKKHEILKCRIPAPHGYKNPFKWPASRDFAWKITQNLPFCPAQDPDKAWYTSTETCLTHLPEVSSKEDVAGGELPKWPERLNAVPPRISRGTLEGITAETFQKDTALWNRRVSYYKAVNNQLEQAGRYRNILDMNAYLGGFAAALTEDPLWVMNVVPVQAKVNTLGVIYERGLIGTYQDWCEAMSTYPRTYDLIHADYVFSLYDGRCEVEDILLEMDRILRPEGSVIFRDDVDVLVKIKKISDGLNWDSQIVDHEDGPHQREKLLFAIKTYWTAPAEGGRHETTTSS
ncbi:hypothetical protein D5086_023854 [Populus alba]|uniref:Uncharacterized protein n=1 Tax=Populus alba TaxID=43335 RepID=A0ACC4BAZ8_POPAL